MPPKLAGSLVSDHYGVLRGRDTWSGSEENSNGYNKIILIYVLIALAAVLVCAVVCRRFLIHNMKKRARHDDAELPTAGGGYVPEQTVAHAGMAIPVPAHLPRYQRSSRTEDQILPVYDKNGSPPAYSRG